MGENIEMSANGGPNKDPHISHDLKHKYESMTKKARIKTSVRLAIVVMCAAAMIYQVIVLTAQYLNGQTLVNIKIEQIKYNKIPAFTVCYPRLLSFKRVAEVYPDSYGQLYATYMDTMRSVAQGDISYHDNNVTTNLNDLYEGNVTALINKEHRLRDLFDLSIPYYYGNRSSSLFNKDKLTEFAIDIHVNAIRLFNNNKTLNVIEITDTEPIESLVVPDGRQGLKCFTFFSQMKPKWREYQIDLKEMNINIYQHESWFPPSLYEGGAHVHLSMHSPNILPQAMSPNNFVRLKTGKWYEMTYNRWKTILLPPRYDTKCREYDLKSTRAGDYQLRADCVNQCVYDGLLKTCDADKLSPLQGQPLGNSDNTGSVNTSTGKIGKVGKGLGKRQQHNATLCLYRSDSLWRQELVGPGAPLADDRICAKYEPGTIKATLAGADKQAFERTVDRRACFRQHASRVNGECELKCPQECNNRYYNYNVKTSDKLPGHSPWTKQTHVRMAHNQLPDQITEHIPEISFVQFIGTFGGLVGMWVGLSAFAVLDFALGYI